MLWALLGVAAAKQCADLPFSGPSDAVHLCWDLSEKDIDFELNLKVGDASGWIALGFPSEQSDPDKPMKYSVAVLGWIDPGSSDNTFIGDYTLTSSYGSPKITGTQNVSNQAIEFSAGSLKLTFRRPRVIPDVASIKPNGTTWILMAHGPLPASKDSVPSKHSQRLIGFVDFSTGEVINGGSNKWVLAHATCMAVAWGFLIPMGILVARHVRDYKGEVCGLKPVWFWLHRIIQTAGLGLAIAGLVIAITKLWSTSEPLHLVLGIIIMVAGLQQPINGILRPDKPKAGQPKPTIRAVWEVYHRWVGRGAVILAVVQAYVGIHITQDDRKLGKWILLWGILLAISIFTTVALELRALCGTAKKKDAPLLAPP